MLQPHQWSEALAWTTVLSSGRIWRESGSTSKTKSKSVFVLHGCQGLKGCLFRAQPCEGSHSNTGTVPISHRQERLLGRADATLAFWPGIPWKNEFPSECTTMLREARARARACCDVNLMMSCCSDGGSKQLNKGIVVFLLHFVKKGAPRPVLLLSSGQTVEPLWVRWSTVRLPGVKKWSFPPLLRLVLLFSSSQDLSGFRCFAEKGSLNLLHSKTSD